jgi:hypothetical protein
LILTDETARNCAHLDAHCDQVLLLHPQADKVCFAGATLCRRTRLCCCTPRLTNKVKLLQPYATKLGCAAVAPG